jgi:hypothetical protein
LTRPPRNAYIPGQPLHPNLHTVGRPVTLFIPGAELMEAGHVARVNIIDDVDLRYDIRVSSGATYRDVKLGTLMNPQPNTFVFAP